MSLCPASPSLQWVPGTAVPHLLGQELVAPSHRYSGPLRLPMACLGVVRFSLSSPDTLHHSSLFVSLLHKGSPERRESPPRAGSLSLDGRHSSP
jgi:hypothetical protein